MIVEPVSFPLTIDGVTVSSRNMADVLQNGVFSFDGDHTLTISGDYTGSGSSDLLRSSLSGLVVNVAADAVLNGNGRDGFDLLADATITGPGALSVLGSGTGVFVTNGAALTIEYAEVSLNASYPLCGNTTGETLTLRGAALTASGTTRE